MLRKVPWDVRTSLPKIDGKTVKCVEIVDVGGGRFGWTRAGSVNFFFETLLPKSCSMITGLPNRAYKRCLKHRRVLA